MCCAACSWDFLGMIGYLLPIMLFVGTCFHLSNQGNIHAAVKLLPVIGVFFTLCGLLQLMFGKAPEGASLMEYYTVSSVNGAGGGLIGGALSGLLSFLLGRAGAYLVLVVFLIICMVCITGKSFVSFVQQGSDRAYQYAREDMDRRRELHAQRAEERRLLKEEQACTRCESGGDCIWGKEGIGQRNLEGRRPCRWNA